MNTRLFPPTVADIAAGVTDVAALPLRHATSLPKAAYTSEEFFAVERDACLAAGWMCVAHVSQVAEPGDFLAVDLLDEPLVVVRGEDREVRVLSRVCVHRGMDLMPEGTELARQGKAKTLLCPYHFWSFDLKGQLVGCPSMERADGFARASTHLPRIRSAVWHGFIFVNLDGKAEALETQYATFSRAIAPWRTEEMEIAISLDWQCRFNWKVMIENWMESYHHLGAHNQTLNLIAPAQTTWTEPEHPHFIHCHLPFKPALAAEIAADRTAEKSRPGFAPVPGLRLDDEQEWGLFLGYPCFMLLTMSDRVLWYRLLPVSAEECVLQTVTLVTPQAKAAPDYDDLLQSETKMLRDFHQEDMLVNLGVQKGLRSAAFVPGRLSHLEEPIWHIQRYLARRLAHLEPGQRRSA